jgi:hypothetical protein
MKLTVLWHAAATRFSSSYVYLIYNKKFVNSLKFKTVHCCAIRAMGSNSDYNHVNCSQR